MIYCRTMNTEQIAVHPMDNMKDTRYVNLIKAGDIPRFLVAVEVNGDDDMYCWEFDMTNLSDYERVKLNIFDTIFECDTMIDLVKELNDIFHDGFENILIEDDEEEPSSCNYCKYRN